MSAFAQAVATVLVLTVAPVVAVLTAVAVERVARWLAPDPDVAAAVERARGEGS